ncbi:BON domain-containing protein [Polynucleobacter sp. AP-Capit-er-40B-B4]|uniref:C1 family peptidase n=1 Tax=Polynucleobacter sp. AP-Capit-er-40B-B4 TaxID=2576927 RepID=UPI001C0C6865|nr:C1 family peptidase [Polynucleobacter sp. AP-Capit-er-40B-B4]MBU3580454.1 BON domain-containing protein [Polynucleobacter sp. AP-Capit-er-40B-B4]
MSLPIVRYLAFLILITAYSLGFSYAYAQSNAISFGLQPATPEQIKRLPVARKYRGYIPPQVDLTSRMLLPGYQGPQSSCVAWAVAYSAESYYANNTNPINSRKRFVGSPAFIYNQLTTDKNRCQSGTTVIDALSLLKQQGVPNLSEFPYYENSCSEIPSEQVRVSAENQRISDFHYIQRNDKESIKAQLYAGHPVIFGMNVPQSFLDFRGRSIYSDLSSGAPNAHAMVLVGYDDNKSAFKVINSWGDWWGDKGYGWIDYDTLISRGYEFYVIDPGFPVPRADEAPVRIIEQPVNPVVPTPAPVPIARPIQPIEVIKPPEPIKPVVVTPPVVVLTSSEIEQKINQASDALPCSRIRTNVSDSGVVTMTGFVRDAPDLKQLVAKANSIPGVKSVNSKINITPWPTCEANQTLGNSKVNTSEVKIEIPNHANGILKHGELFNIQVNTANTAGFLYLTYLQANGEAVELMWGKTVPANSRVKFGGQLQVSEPFGQEMLIAIVSPQPLFKANNDAFTDRRFLSSLRETLAKVPNSEIEQISVSVLPIKTVER